MLSRVGTKVCRAVALQEQGLEIPGLGALRLTLASHANYLKMLLNGSNLPNEGL